MTSWITICDTCKADDWVDKGMDKTDGEALADLVEAVAEGAPNVQTRRHSCLMGCNRACNVTIQAAGKLSYSLGEFEVSEDAARAIVDYAVLHSQTDSGTVPYRTWPEGVKGHFVSRHPPLPEV